MLTVRDWLSQCRTQLLDTMQRRFEGYEGSLPKHVTSSEWFDYKGGEAAPFTLYLRASMSGLILSNISALPNKRGKALCQQQRMPVIMAAFEELSHNPVVVEQVLNEHLEPWLVKRGYVAYRVSDMIQS